MTIFIRVHLSVFRFRYDGVKFMKALVLSGGGLFGAWQAGAWSVLAERFEPELIVGASIGSVNGYLLASGVTPEELVEMWCDPEFRRLDDLHGMLRRLTSRYSLRRPFALTVTDILTLQPRVYRDEEITWRHLAASCAVPPVMPQVKLDGRWCTDGGLLNPLPVYAATDLGATKIEGLHVLEQFPSLWLRPFVEGFRLVFGYKPDLPAGVALRVRGPSERLGGLKESLWGTQGDIERWVELGRGDAKKTFRGKMF
jgi:NTE family protein